MPVPIGEPAINPVPRQMIRDTIAELLGDAGARNRGVLVEIAVPNGVELAAKTFNPRLGIVGGISILGTSGIVVPYSNAAWVASVIQAIDVAVAAGLQASGADGRWPQRAFGASSCSRCRRRRSSRLGRSSVRRCGIARSTGIERVSIVAMIGKLAKFAAGNESVHSSASRQDFDFLASLAARAGGGETLQRIAAANTAQEVAQMLADNRAFFVILCKDAWRFGRTLLGEAGLDIVLAGVGGEVLAAFTSFTRP